MKIDVTLDMFRNKFVDYDRGEQFSYEGLEALYEYLIDLERDMGEEIILDVIALCCEFTEYESSTLVDIASDFGEDFETEEEAKEWLQGRTEIIEVLNGGYIIRDF